MLALTCVLNEKYVKSTKAPSNFAAVDGGAGRHSVNGLRLQPILQTLFPLGVEAVARDAPEAPCRRTAVRGLCGHTVDVVCPKTGEVRTAQMFVATMGASNFTYVEASWMQTLPDWILSHVRVLTSSVVCLRKLFRTS